MSLTEYHPPVEAVNTMMEESEYEEIRERNDYLIEEAVNAFVDEPSIRHDEVPDYEPEEGDDSEEWFQRRTEAERQHLRRGSGELFEGQVFVNGFAFKEHVLDYALKTGYNISQYRYDKFKIGYSCVGEGCQWRVYCSVNGSSEKWQIRVFYNAHTCVPNGECDMIKVPVITKLFLDKLRDEPDYYLPMKIEEIMMERWKISVTRGQCQAARNKGLRMIEREYNEQFGRLRDYGAEIQLSNPGSTVEIATRQTDEGQTVFDRLYVCFDNLRRSWKDTCRPLIGLDGCFMRGKMKGQILVALGRDGNNGIYPIAWAVVQVENLPNWLWFLQKVKADLVLGDGDGYIMISDRQKGLIRAVELELPKIEHRMCVRHIYANLRANHGKKPLMKPLLWNLAWSYNEADYNERLDRIFRYDAAVHRDVLKTNPRSWCRAFYKTGNHCEDVENNSTESFNKSIVQARERPLVPMLETITRLAMVRIAKRDVKAHLHKGILTPYAQNVLASLHDKAAECQVHRSTNNNFQVIVKGCAYRVSLDRRTCSCKRWDISGIPCEHGYGVIMKLKLEVADYVANWFQTSMWRRTYTEGLTPMRGARFWPSGTEETLQPPPEPPQPGRNKNKKKKKDKRKKGVNESPTKKKVTVFKRVVHCRVCGEAGHNARKHKTSTVCEPSQGILTQANP